jgi:hypothetical protein
VEVVVGFNKMNIKKLLQTTQFWKVTTLGLLSFFVFIQVSPGGIRMGDMQMDTDITIIKTAEASEIYPMFTCPCCDQPLNKEEPCCGSMTQMIDYIDEQISTDMSKEGVVLATAKEFGLDRLTNEEDRIALEQLLIELAPADAPRIEINETGRDLGIVSQSQGTVSTDFEFRNIGRSDLVINKLSSSCGCTSGSIVYKGEVGPEFAMEGHGKENPKDWEVAIKPGDTAILRVFYNPTVHPDLEGAVTRTVSIMSNDPVEFETQVMISLEQAK